MSKVQTAVQRAKAQRKDHAEKPGVMAASDFPQRREPRHAKGHMGPILKIDELPHVDVDWSKLKGNRILTHDNSVRHPAQNAYRMLRTRTMQVMRANNWQILGVSSIRENEGKTFTAINLAISIAAEIGQDVVLVDLDLRKPSIFEYFAIEFNAVRGLKEYLEDHTQCLDNLLVCPGIERLGLLLSATPFERSSDVLASDRGKHLFAELRERLSPRTVIVVDLPPLLAADDALAVAPALDALLLVVAESQSERADVQESRHLLESFNILGTVLNKSAEKDSKRASYYY
jgi:capsular exopolysaccharide synthesis family protein